TLENLTAPWTTVHTTKAAGLRIAQGSMFSQPLLSLGLLTIDPHDEDEDEYAHLNKIDNHEPDIYRDFGIEKASGSDFGKDYDEKGSPCRTPRRVVKNSFGDDYNSD
ncbi:hypothetical protein RHS03_08995, partial [Rhizoctonia solani]